MKLRLFLALLFSSQLLHGQTPQPPAELVPGVDDTWNLRWWGVQGRSYFLQASDDLIDWQFAPLIEGGNDEVIEYETGSLGDRHFVRLLHTDQTASDLDAADFDDDNLGNLAEITTHHTHPLRKDSDSDGMPDGWEIGHGLDPNDDGSTNPVNGPHGDADGDGSSNLNEFLGKNDPTNPQDFPAQFNVVTRSVVANTTTYPGSVSGSATWSCGWNGQSDTASLSAELTPSSVSGSLASKYAFQNEPPQNPNFVTAHNFESINLQVASGLFSGSTSSGVSPRRGELEEARAWIRSTSTPNIRKYRLLKVTKSTSIPLNTGTEPAQETSTISGVDVETFTIAGGAELSDAKDFLPEVPYVQGTKQRTLISLKDVRIKPAEGMAGVVGDMVASNQDNDPELHFVSPKKTDEIPNDYVILEATGLIPEDITDGLDRLVAWSGDGESVPDKPLQWRVKRDQAKKNVVSLKTLGQFGAKEVAKVNVWVVWAQITKIKEGRDTLVDLDGKTRVVTDWKFKASIFPTDIYMATQDIPDLSGLPGKAVPEVDIGNHALDGMPFVNAKSKWDLARRWRARSWSGNLTALDCGLFPHTIIGGDYPTGLQSKIHRTTLEAGPDHYPTDPVEGNDSTPANQDPYFPGGTPGFLLDEDGPREMVKTNAGAVGDVFESKWHFGEFARLDIGAKWYRISDYSLWRLHSKLKKVSEVADDQDYNGDGDKIDSVWIDDGSTSEGDNQGF